MGSEQLKSVWVRDKRTDGIVGYCTPDGRIVRIANAGDIYARYLRVLREQTDAAAARE